MYKVLIADDEAIIRKGLIKIIDWESLGYEIVGEASNGKEVLNFIDRDNPDVVLIDIKMPTLHGLDAIRTARENGFTGRFIILSGFADFSYAQEAIKYGVSSYITKPVDENALADILSDIKNQLDEEFSNKTTESFIKTRARNVLLEELLLGMLDSDELASNTLELVDEPYKVVLYETYSRNPNSLSYNFLDLLELTNKNGSEYEHIKINENDVILLKGEASIEKFNKILSKYLNDVPPEKNSPLDTVFITCGREVSDIADIHLSYKDAHILMQKRFFFDQYQHVVEYSPQDDEVEKSNMTPDEIMSKYTTSLVNHIQAYKRNKIAETLHELQEDLYNSSISIDDEKNLLVDIYLLIKEKISFLYKTSNIPFLANSEAVNIILQSYYLYEIIAFFSKQFEMIMGSIGYSSRDSIIDDIVHYIDHNYSENITLENIAPLFGYNSSYLGKIFSKKMDVNFNTYLDNIRIEHSKELLLANKIQVYKVAELVGYRNVDYFHIKFKKSTGMSPAEFRRRNKPED